MVPVAMSCRTVPLSQTAVSPSDAFTSPRTVLVATTVAPERTVSDDASR